METHFGLRDNRCKFQHAVAARLRQWLLQAIVFHGIVEA